MRWPDIIRKRLLASNIRMQICGRIIRILITRKRKQTLVLALVVLAFIGFLHFSDIGTSSKRPSITRGSKTKTIQQLAKATKTQIPTTKRVTQQQLKRPPPPTTPPQPQFQLTLPFIEPNLRPKEKNLFMAVVVNTAANGVGHRMLRKTIRETWGDNNETFGKGVIPWKLFFCLGFARNQSDHNTNLKEAREHNDIIIGDFADTYRNVVLKTFMGMFWAVTKLSCKYVLKTDDDVYVRVPHLMTWLKDTGSPRSFYGGCVSKFVLIPRNPLSKWYISPEQYGGANWPPWIHGAYTVFSTDVIPRYLIYTYRRKPFHADDAYIGVASNDLGIKAVHIPRFAIEHEKTDQMRTEKELNESITIGHKVTPARMVQYHNYYLGVS